MVSYTCEICKSKVYSMRDKADHILEHYREISEEKIKPEQYQNVQNTAKLDPMDQVEQRMAQQLRLMQMQQMIQMLRNPTTTTQDTSKMSDMIGIVKAIGGLRADLKEEVLSELDQAGDGDGSMIKDVLGLLAMQKQGNPAYEAPTMQDPGQTVYSPGPAYNVTNDAAPAKAETKAKARHKSKK